MFPCWVSTCSGCDGSVRHGPIRCLPVVLVNNTGNTKFVVPMLGLRVSWCACCNIRSEFAFPSSYTTKTMQPRSHFLVYGFCLPVTPKMVYQSAPRNYDNVGPRMDPHSCLERRILKNMLPCLVLGPRVEVCSVFCACTPPHVVIAMTVQDRLMSSEPHMNCDAQVVQ